MFLDRLELDRPKPKGVDVVSFFLILRGFKDGNSSFESGSVEELVLPIFMFANTHPERIPERERERQLGLLYWKAPKEFWSDRFGHVANSLSVSRVDYRKCRLTVHVRLKRNVGSTWGLKKIQ